LIRPPRLSVSAGRTSTDRSPKHIELVSNGHNNGQNDQVRPLLSLLEKEPPSRHVSGQLDYVHHLSGLGRHETILPLLHASTERKTNGELDLIMAEFAGTLFCALYFRLQFLAYWCIHPSCILHFCHLSSLLYV
jgi:hypothetical protein